MVHAEQTTRETGLLSLPMEPIAIVGLALKFPGDADSEDGLWHVLTESKCTMTEWPEDRLNIDAYHSLSRREKSSVRASPSCRTPSPPLTHPEDSRSRGPLPERRSYPL